MSARWILCCACVLVVPACVHRGPPEAVFDERLQVAIGDDDPGAVARILEEEPRLVDARRIADLGTALHRGAGDGRPAVIAELIARGADVDARDYCGRTPLVHAIEADSLPCVEALLAAGADPRARDDDGVTPILHAALLERHGLLAALLAQAPFLDIHEAAALDLSGRIEELLASDAGLVEARLGADDDLRTPLHLACALGCPHATAALLARGARVDARDAVLSTPLHAAAAGGHEQLIAPLVAAGAVLDAQDGVGFTPLHHAALHGHLATVEALLEAGASPRAEDGRGRRPDHWANRNGFVPVRDRLRRAGVVAGGALDAPSASASEPR